MFPRIASLLPSLIALMLLGSVAWGDETAAGQPDLDKATEAKLSAQSLTDLGEVIRLCQSAQKAGLDDTNKDFATKLLAGTLVQRAEAYSSQIFDRPTPPARWQQLRRVALIDLEKSLGLEPNQPDAHFLLGRLQALPGGDLKRALEALNEAVKLSGKEPANRARALVLRAQLVEDPLKRGSDLDEAVKLAPRNAEVLNARALFYLDQKKYAEAVADLDVALELEPNSAKAHEARGIAQYLLKNFDEAHRSFDKVIELVPNAISAYTQRSRVKSAQGDAPGALADLDKALDIDSTSIPVLLLRASLRQQAGDIDNSLEDVEQVLRLQPGLGKAVQMRAILIASKGKFSDAIEDLEQLREKTPDDAELLMQLGMLYNAGRQPEKAIETYSAVVEADPKNWPALRGRADSFLSLGKQDKAVADYEAALKVQPDDSGTLNNLAWLLATSPEEKLRDGKRSIDLAKRACEVTKYEQPHILSTLAAAYAESGDFDQAKEWASKAVELGNPQIKDQLSKELESYQQQKPWREAHPPTTIAGDDSDDVEKDSDKKSAGSRGTDNPAKEKAGTDDAEEGPSFGSANPQADRILKAVPPADDPDETPDAD